MREEQYQQLCEACDHLLLEPDVKKGRIAIPWLHIIREHAVFLSNYENLFDTGSLSQHISAFSIRLAIKNLVTISKLALKKRLWWVSSHEKSKIDILFVSHLVDKSHSGQERDFYFGDLPSTLLKNGVRSSVVLLNHTSESGESLIEKWKHSNVPRYILLDFLGFWSEAKFYLSGLLESHKLKKYSKGAIPELNRRVAQRAAFEARLGSAIPNLRLGKQICRLVRDLEPRVIITTYEGHAWERIVYAEAREANSSIHCVGYQHAAIFRLQHALLRKLAERYNPGTILSAGLAGFGQLKKSGALKGVSLGILGSNRGAFYPEDIQVQKIGSTCLVMPDGILTECIILFNFSLACAKERPDVKFIWRLHPLINFTQIQNEIKEFNQLPGNVIISQSVIEDDIKNSNYALYRGTTAIIQAINAGLIPIYYNFGEFVIDPMYEINQSDFYVSNTEEFSTLVTLEPGLPIHPKLSSIQDYSLNFFSPFNFNILLEAIKSDSLGKYQP